MLGCAADRATTGALNLAESVALKVADEVPLNSGAVYASGEINDPKYEVVAGLLNGVYVSVGLKGARLKGDLQGAGSGGPTEASPEMRAAFGKILTRPDLQTKVLDLVRSQLDRTTAEPPR